AVLSLTVPLSVNAGREWLHGNCLAFSPDGKCLAVCCKEGTIRVLSAETGEELRTVQGQRTGVTSVSFSPGGDRLASAGLDGPVRLLDATRGGKAVVTLASHQDCVLGVAFLPDGKRIATAGWDGVLKVWDVTTGKEIRSMRGHERGL